MVGQQCSILVAIAVSGALAPIASPQLAASGAGLELPGIGAPGGPARELRPHDAERWMAGRALFMKTFQKAEGLGPAFNAESCSTCHKDPAIGGAGGLEFNVGGEEDGAPLGYSLRGGHSGDRPQVAALLRARAARRRAEDDAPRAVGLQTPSLLGMGLIETIFEDEILANEDPHDRDGDGVRGVANRVDVGDGRTEVGRFGWFAQAPTVEDFVRGACGGELGLTVPYPVDDRGFGRLEDGDDWPDPELDWLQVEQLTFFCRELAAPTGGDRDLQPDVLRGEELFLEVGCGACHVPSLPGRYGLVWLYSDLLTHALVETRPEKASGPAPEETTEAPRFRTPPLWGVSATGPWMHQGAASTFEEAIELHGGEAADARATWRALDEGRRQSLLAFLENL